jgi:hypothetical protein
MFDVSSLPVLTRILPLVTVETLFLWLLLLSGESVLYSATAYPTVPLQLKNEMEEPRS